MGHARKLTRTQTTLHQPPPIITRQRRPGIRPVVYAHDSRTMEEILDEMTRNLTHVRDGESCRGWRMA